MHQQNLTLPEFLAWEQTQPIRHEFYQGETFAMEGNTASHNRVVLNVASFISEQADVSVHQVFCQGMRVHVDEGSFYPDIVVTSGMHPAGDDKVVRHPMHHRGTLVVDERIRPTSQAGSI